ncbi:alpha/beta hydrolase family protein [Ferdinandcohnia quinoae]|uniref:1-alkyl-2-acetylglycerophosphocholine esterase n=1 Tax=Fredinandcohnia quinoae TaxID=2918902 RepID=A0AAW5E673_9BACI|nr:hypothetical protein [Fredinandcohnia sp. SECRCQ15]MCH1625387.1 hypothetical protein [Fredinandcohnia sp. SECRCQ15]
MVSNLKVGRVIKVIDDFDRKEVFDDRKEFHSFPVSIYYPTNENTTNKPLTSLFEPAIEKAIEIFSMVGINEEKLKEVIISIKENAEPVQNTSYPVLLFSPGFGIDRDLYIESISAIVQKGYIVVAISVPYDSFATVFPDGEFIFQAEHFPDDQSQIESRMKDASLVLDHLEKWNQEEFFNGIFDTNRVGVMGHSLGGATVFNLATIDERLSCAVLYDASLFLVDNKIPNIPVLNLRQEASSYEEYLEAISGGDDAQTSEEIARVFIEKQKNMYDFLPASSSFMKVIGANHLSFSTIGRLLSGAETPDVTKTINELTIAFLNDFLKGEKAAYSEWINGKDRPANLVEIDGSGFPVD